jgi:hypothetical protein
MALYNEILTGRHNRFIQKLFGIKGRPPAPQLSGDIQMSHAIFAGEETRYLESWRRFALSLNIGPTAAQTEAGQLRNPAGSNVIAVLESISMTGSVATTMTISEAFTGVADLINIFAAASLDPRQGTVTGSVMQASTSAGGAVDLGVSVRRCGIGTVFSELMLAENQGWPLLPGQAYRFRQETVNMQTILCITYRERFLEEGERT